MEKNDRRFFWAMVLTFLLMFAINLIRLWFGWTEPILPSELWAG